MSLSNLRQRLVARRIELSRGVASESDETEASREIVLIDRALRRFDEGRFDRCIECGAQISEARLGVAPYETHCQDCAPQ